MQVKTIGEDLYEVSGFVESMPHLVYQVIFERDVPRVVYRQGTTEKHWDRHAIGAVQAALVAGVVE